MEHAVVTGAGGFIGVHLCGELIKRGKRVTGLVRPGSASSRRLPDSVTVMECDMDAYGQLALEDADVFYHLAWEGASGPGRGDAMLQVKNAERSLAALAASVRIGCKRFVALGSVYERLVPQIVAFQTFRQADFYLLSKDYTHRMCRAYAAKNKTDFVWATVFHPIGAYIKPEQMMAYAVRGLLRGEAPAFGPALEPYDITAVENIAQGLYLLGEKELSRDEYYIGSGTPRRLKEYLAETKDILGTETPLMIGAREDDGLRFSFDWYDTTSLREDTGYCPDVDFATAVRNTAEWIRKQDHEV